jgi:hypothetical protein
MVRPPQWPEGAPSRFGGVGARDTIQNDITLPGSFTPSGLILMSLKSINVLEKLPDCGTFKKRTVFLDTLKQNRKARVSFDLLSSIYNKADHRSLFEIKQTSGRRAMPTQLKNTLKWIARQGEIISQFFANRQTQG